ncbi:hypothetical protein HOG16_01775, partial [Candidatus Woesearchaeota archaeon]|nr:hypothetical protein [Candidatus Woesearchaeota archaeon]
MALDIYGFIRDIEYYGFFQYLVPFLICFAILFALLEKTHVFGENKKNLNIGLSLLLSFTILTNTELLDFLNASISNISLMIILFSIVMLLFMFIMKVGEGNTPLRYFALVLAVFATIWALVEAKYFNPYGDFTGAMYTFLYYLEPFIDVIIFLA